MEVESVGEDRHPKCQHMALCTSVRYCRLEDGGSESAAVGYSLRTYRRSIYLDTSTEFLCGPRCFLYGFTA
jgi:hypothetical protein